MIPALKIMKRKTYLKIEGKGEEAKVLDNKKRQNKPQEQLVKVDKQVALYYIRLEDKTHSIVI
jgi:hypothetical protein